jgi:PAS domain S-box-containing protein
MNNPSEKSPPLALREQLLDRRDVIVEHWYKALTPTGIAHLGHVNIRHKLSHLTDQVLELLTAESFEQQQAASIGSQLAKLHYVSPQALARTQMTLTQSILQDLPQEWACALHTRLISLVAGLSTGFIQQSQETILREQERIRNTLINEIQKAERELRLKETAIASSINAICFCDMKEKITYVNPAFLETWGYDEPEEVLGRPMSDIAFRSENVSNVIQAIRESGGWIGELVAQKKDGTHFYVQVSASILKDANGQPIQMMGSFINITDRKEAEKEVKQHLARLETLHKIDRAILKAKSPQEIAEVSLRQIYKLVPCQRSSVVLFDFEAEQMEVLAVQLAGETGIKAGGRYPMQPVENYVEALKDRDFITDDITQHSDRAEALSILHSEGLKRFLSVPLRHKRELIGALSLWSNNDDAFGEKYIPLAQEIANSITIAIWHARLLESLNQQQEQLRMILKRLSEAEEIERRRVARTLHDRVGQNLTALGLNLNVIRTQLGMGIPQQVDERIDDSLRLVEVMAERIRRVTADLRPPMLEDYGLGSALEWYARQSSQRAGIDIKVDAEESNPQLAPEVENALFRIAQEAVTNAIKHAQASQAEITLRAASPLTRMEVKDNGIGFDPSKTSSLDHKHGLGLLSMQERAQSVGGECFVESNPNRGTRVIVEVETDA